MGASSSPDAQSVAHVAGSRPGTTQKLPIHPSSGPQQPHRMMTADDQAVRSDLWWRRLAISTLLLLTTGCSSIEEAGTRAGTPFTQLSQLCIWSFAWLLPAVAFYIKTAGPHIRTRDGWGPRGGFSSTAQDAKRNAMCAAMLWIALYPFYYFYYPVFSHAEDIVITGRPNMDWALLKVIIPVGALPLIVMVITLVFRSPVALAAAYLTMVLVGGGVLNMVGWLGYLAVRWLVAK